MSAIMLGLVVGGGECLMQVVRMPFQPTGSQSTQSPIPTQECMHTVQENAQTNLSRHNKRMHTAMSDKHASKKKRNTTSLTQASGLQRPIQVYHPAISKSTLPSAFANVRSRTLENAGASSGLDNRATIEWLYQQ
ncbi:hypothetical protein FH972_002592 [Carpinus fangiana]|uniref:Uncharacterized protein n=1 Tax=Carpinus fangiana TaxID=176857 RepID=A0A5N6QIG1_9ROSI|nr:hypothetical protein FH972_002592 [Carpinus fangiana]